MINDLAKILPAVVSYDQYYEMVVKMVEAGTTSGPNQSESLIKYTKLNLQRMKRLNRSVVIAPDLLDEVSKIPIDMRWIVISEGWCGDAAQNLPYIAHLAAKSPNVDLGIVFRDENMDFMDSYLTNGSRSIPKLIIFTAEDHTELATWGPRPAPVQEMVMNYKNQIEHKVPFDQFAEDVHAWYARDKNASLEKELLAIFRSLN